MERNTLHARRAVPETTLRDFVIEGAAELGACFGAQSFRATRRAGGQPVLLHKFRPAQSLVDLGPRVAPEEPPDFARPFVTQFTDLFVVAGSAYLVEPLPPCFALTDLWRYVLQTRPDQAMRVVATLMRHLSSILHQLAHQHRYHGALTLENIVLAPTACFGILAAHLSCREGRLWLRKDPESPLKPDYVAFAEVLTSLLEVEAQTAALRNLPRLLPAMVRCRLEDLLHAVEQVAVAS